jgi:hypothetical protein
MDEMDSPECSLCGILSRMSTNTNNLVARLLDSMSTIELMRIVPLTEVARLRGTSPDTVVREDQRRVARGELSRIVKPSERRRGMRLIYALCPDAD